MTDSWWNTSYSIRNQLTIINDRPNEIVAGSPLYALLDTVKLLSLNKMRTDFEDIEILYWNSTLATPTWNLLGREIEYDSGTGIITIIFNAENNIDLSDVDYYIYYCNSPLKNQGVRPAYEPSTYSTVLPVLEPGIMFTRPTEDWVDGISQVVNARAAFAFYGKYVKLVLQGRNDGGILEIKANKTTPTYHDTYLNASAEVEVIYSFDEAEKQTLHMRATGGKNPTSNDSIIELKRIEYSRYIESEIEAEEIYSIFDGVKTTIGS